MTSLPLAFALSLAALAQDPTTHPAQSLEAPSASVTTVPWAGIPLASLPALGLGEPTLDEHLSAWRAPLPGGGFVHLTHYADAAQARDAFAFRALSASTRPLPPLAWDAPGRDVQAVGDTTGMLVLRDGNLVLVVRDHQERAGALAQRLEAAMVTAPPAADLTERDLGDRVVRWDACGRLVD